MHADEKPQTFETGCTDSTIDCWVFRRAVCSATCSKNELWSRGLVSLDAPAFVEPVCRSGARVGTAGLWMAMRRRSGWTSLFHPAVFCFRYACEEPRRSAGPAGQVQSCDLIKGCNATTHMANLMPASIIGIKLKRDRRFPSLISAALAEEIASMTAGKC